MENVFLSKDIDRDIERYMNEKALQESEYPVCSCCGEDIYQVSAWRVNGKWYCDNCEDEAISALANIYKEDTYHEF